MDAMIQTPRPLEQPLPTSQRTECSKCCQAETQATTVTDRTTSPILFAKPDTCTPQHTCLQQSRLTTFSSVSRLPRKVSTSIYANKSRYLTNYLFLDCRHKKK